MSGAPNINRASTESDEHQIATIPPSLPVYAPTVLRTTHDFYYSNAPIGTDTNAANWSAMPLATRADVGPFRFLSINLNTPFAPVAGIWDVHSTAGFSNSQSVVWADQTRRFPNGVNLYRSTYRYYRVAKSEWSIELSNEMGLRSSVRWVPVRVGYFEENNDGADFPDFGVPALASPSVDSTAKFMMHPRTGFICGGAVMGPPAIRGFDGDGTTEVTTHSYANSLRTNFTFDGTSGGGATDPLSTAKKIYWQSGTQLPTDIRRLHFYFITAGATSGDHNNVNDRAFVYPYIRIKVRYTMDWRDMNASGDMNSFDEPPP